MLISHELMRFSNGYHDQRKLIFFCTIGLDFGGIIIGMTAMGDIFELHRPKMEANYKNEEGKTNIKFKQMRHFKVYKCISKV